MDQRASVVSSTTEHIYDVLLMIGLFVMGLYDGQREVMICAMVAALFANLSHAQTVYVRSVTYAAMAIVAWLSGFALLFIY